MGVLATAVAFPGLNDAPYPVSRVASLLEPYLQAIVERVRPLRIVLFGSYAYGSPTEHSDFDLLVIRPDIRSSKESNIELRMAIKDVEAPPASFTFLSQTPEGLRDKIKSGSFIYREIVEKGIELYAAQADQ
jgi:uncharacterized protein